MTGERNILSETSSQVITGWQSVEPIQERAYILGSLHKHLGGSGRISVGGRITGMVYTCDHKAMRCEVLHQIIGTLGKGRGPMGIEQDWKLTIIKSRRLIDGLA